MIFRRYLRHGESEHILLRGALRLAWQTLLLVSASSCLAAGATPCVLAQTWASALKSSSDDDSAEALVVTPGGRWIIAGAAKQSGYVDDALLLAVDAQGDVIWSKIYGGTARDLFSDVLVLDDGRILAAGTTRSFGMGNADALVMTTDARGRVVWARAYGLNLGEALSAVGLVGGDAILVGGESNDFSRSDFLVMKIDLQGNLIWQHTYGISEEFESIEDLVVTPDGGALLVGSTSLGEDYQDHALAVKIDASGAIEWQRTFRMEGQDLFRAVVALDDGGYLIAGQAHTTHSLLARGWLLRLDSQGELVWHEELPVDSLDGASFYDLILTTDGMALASGDYTPYPAQRSEAWQFAFDPAGGLPLWQRSYGSFDLERLYGSQCLPDRGCMFAGLTDSYSPGPLYNLNDVFALRTEADGLISPACSIGGIPDAVAEQQPVVVESYTGVVGELTGFTVTELALEAISVDTPREEICTGTTLFPPTEVSPSESLAPLLFTDATHLEWEDAGPSASETFDLYRGDVTELSSGSAGECLAGGLVSSGASDPEQPDPAVAWFYLVGGSNGAGRGPLGFATGGSERQAAGLCP